MRIQILILIAVILLLILKIQNYNPLNINLLPSPLVEENQKLITQIVSQFRTYCRTNQKIKVNLKIDYAPTMLTELSPNQEGFSSFFADESWIEVNQNLFKNKNDLQKKYLLWHELGHILGLDHEEVLGSVMNPTVQQEVNEATFWGRVRGHCQKINDLPRKPNFSRM